MQKKILFIFIALFFVSLSFVSADCPVKVKAKTTPQLLVEASTINADLANCPTAVPNQLKKLITNGQFLLQITDADDIVATIKSGNVTEVKVSEGAKYTYKITVTSCQLDNILSKENPAGAFAAYYLSGKANLGASGVTNKVKLWFAKFFIKPAFKRIKVDVDDCTASSSGARPENCFDTYMPGYQEYNDPKVKEIWDARLAETGDVCQTQTSEAPKGECKYLYEQIKNNDKKWVCWY